MRGRQTAVAPKRYCLQLIKKTQEEEVTNGQIQNLGARIEQVHTRENAPEPLEKIPSVYILIRPNNNKQTLYAYLTNTSSRKTRPEVFQATMEVLARNYSPNHLTIQTGWERGDTRTYITETQRDVIQVLLSREEDILQPRIMIQEPWTDENVIELYHHIRPQSELEERMYLDITAQTPTTRQDHPTVTASTTHSSYKRSTSETNPGRDQINAPPPSTPLSTRGMSISYSERAPPTSAEQLTGSTDTLVSAAGDLQKAIRRYNESNVSADSLAIACVTVCGNSIKLELYKET